MADKAKVYADSQGNMFIKSSELFESDEFKRTMEKLKRIFPQHTSVGSSSDHE